MTISIKITAYLHSKNRGFRLTKTISLMDLNSPIFRLNKTFFYRKLFNIETRRERLSNIFDKWEISRVGDYDGILGEHRYLIETIQDGLSIVVNKILNSKNLK